MYYIIANIFFYNNVNSIENVVNCDENKKNRNRLSFLFSLYNLFCYCGNTFFMVEFVPKLIIFSFIF